MPSKKKPSKPSTPASAAVAPASSSSSTPAAKPAAAPTPASASSAPAAGSDPNLANNDADENEDGAEESKGVTAERADRDMTKMAGYLDQVANGDEMGITKGLSFVTKQIQRQKIARTVREKEAARIEVDAADVDILMAEMEMTRLQAERSLREHKGVLEDTIKALIA